MAIYDINGNDISTGGASGTSQSELQRRFSGKKIIWLGDSIHAYAKPDGVTIPYLFQYHSGAKCYNWAQGGMTMALTGTANYDPYSGVGMVDALVSGDFSDQETYASEDHGTAQGNFIEQVAEMKAFDMASADALIIEFGANDAFKQVPTDNADNVLDKTTTGGALRYMLKALQTAYPLLPIAVCNVQKMSGYSDSEHQQPYDSKIQNEVIESVCSELSIPVIDIYDLLGLNEYTSATLLSDGAHRSHAGKLRQVQIIENRMTQLF